MVLMRVKQSTIIYFMIYIFILLANVNVAESTYYQVYPGSSIQHIVNCANDGDTIIVHNGRYSENVDVYKELKIISDSGDPYGTIIEAADPNDHVFNVTADNVIISGLSITGTDYTAKAGIFLDETEGCDIHNNILSYNRCGIYLWRASNNILTDNTANSNDFRGIRLESSSSNTLKHNTVNLNKAHGIYLCSSNNNILSSNIILNNQKGVCLLSSGNNVLNNNIAQSNTEGIYLSDSKNNILSNNTANLNIHCAIELGSYSNNRNKLINNTATSNDYGIIIEGTDNELKDNTVNSNNEYGIYLMGDDNELSNNRVSNNNYGVYLSNSNRNLVYNNYFNNIYNAYIEGTSTGNLWNTDKTASINLINGSYLGGNYWLHPDGTGYSENCKDIDFNGFCDSPYIIDENNTDYLPLTVPVLPSANFSVDVTSSNSVPFTVKFQDSSSSATSWEWDVGDGATYTTKNVTHTYYTMGIYNVTLKAGNPTGTNTVTKVDFISVGILPIADFSVDKKSGYAPLDVRFIDKSTNATELKWNFGDNSPLSNETNPVHSYYSVGNYPVTLTASNPIGSTVEAKENYITVLSPEKPSASFSANIRSGDVPLSVLFSDASKNANSWEWDLNGDGLFDSKSQNPIYVYDVPGCYNVSLTVSNEFGNNTKKEINYIIVSKKGIFDNIVDVIIDGLPTIIAALITGLITFYIAVKLNNRNS